MDGGAAGILIAPDLQKVFAGTPNGLAIVDVDPGSSSYAQVVTISIGKGGSDELDYDPITRTVYFTDGVDQEIGVADAKMNTLIKVFTGIDEPRRSSSHGSTRPTA